MKTFVETSRTWGMVIGGELIQSSSGATLEVINPATLEQIAEIPDANSSDVGHAVDSARRAFSRWRMLSPLERAELVGAWADAIEANAEELAILDTLDNGSPIREMRKDVHFAVAQMRYFCGSASLLGGKTIPTPDGSLDFTLREPFGVVARIVPFNHPLLFAAARSAPALVAGNTVVLKPSEHTSLSAIRLGEIASEIFPAGTFNVVTGLGAVVGDALVTHPDVPRIAFTGHVDTGRAIQRRAAETDVKSVTLELGGKNPLIVFPDADLDDAISGALRGMNFTWQGQSCGSTSRLFVHRSIFNEFIERLGEQMDALRQGDPTDEDTEVGAIVSRRQFDKVMSFIRRGRDDPGIQLVAGGGPPHDDRLSGLFIRPTLFVSHDDDNPLSQEEIFGPVLVAKQFDTYDEAISRANAVRFGLTASVWTSQLVTGLKAAQDLHAGYIWVNTVSTHILGAPFGGFKASGIGREEGIEEMLGYTQVKNVNIAL